MLILVLNPPIEADTSGGVRWVTASANRLGDRTRIQKYAHTVIVTYRGGVIVVVVKLDFLLRDMVENASLEQSRKLIGHAGKNQGLEVNCSPSGRWCSTNNP